MAGDSGGRQAEGDVDAGRRPAEPARLLRLPAESAADARHAASWTRRTSTRRSRGAATVVKATYLLSVSDARLDRQLVRRRRRAGRQGHDLVGDAGGLSAAEQRGDAARPAGRERARRSSRDGLRLLRHQRRRHGVLRRGAAVAGGRQAGARAALAQGRDGVGELRPRVTSSTSASALDADGTIVAWDSRGVVAVARRPARLRTTRATSSPACWPASSRRAFTPRAPAPEPTGFDNGSNAAPSYVTGCVGGRVRRHGHGRERARAHAHRAVAVLHRPAAIAGAAAEHVRARIVHGRDRGAGEGRSGRVPPASPERPAADRRREGGGEGGELGDAAVAAAGRPPDRRRAAAAASSCVLYEGDNGYCAMVAEVDVDQATGAGRGQAARDRAATAARSRIPTALRTSSKAARCRA